MTANGPLPTSDALASSGSGRMQARARVAATVAVLVAIALAATAQVAAGGHGATRTLDVESVEPGGELTVTIEVTDFGPYGKVTETLPEGSTFLSSDLPEGAVTAADGVAGFILYNTANADTVTFTYSLKAPAAPGDYAFEGVVQDYLREADAVGGDSKITVMHEPWPHCLRGDLADGLSLVVYEGGTIEELDACAASRAVTVLYTVGEGEWVSYRLGGTVLRNEPFVALYPDGVPAFTALVAKSDGASDDPAGELAAPVIWSRCLQGDLAAGFFSLAVYAGGSVDDLHDCVSSRGIRVVWVLHEGDWVSYLPKAHEDRNRAFRDLYAGGLPPVTPLVVRGDDPLPAAVETAARALLAETLDADARDFGLESSESVEWSDASLGCPHEDEVYAQVVTPGYRMTFMVAEASHAVHANADGSHLKICEDGE